MKQASRSAEEVRTTERAAFYRRKRSSAHPRAAPVRWRVCEGLEFLGTRLDPRRKRRTPPLASATATR